MFLLGERHRGTVMAFVDAPYAADCRFTSALPSQLLQALVPSVAALLEAGACR